MRTNRLIYLAFLIAMAAFFVFYEGWFSLFAFALTVLLPLFSLIISLPVFTGVNPSITADTLLYAGDTLTLQVNVSKRNGRSAGRCRLRFEKEDLIGQKTESYKLVLDSADDTLHSEPLHAGIYRFRIKKLWVTDLLDLFKLPVRTSASVTVTVLPVKTVPEPVPDLDSLTPLTFVPSRTKGFSEVTDIRDYRPGDSLRSVHWKLTAKTGDILVKEPQENILKKIIIAVSASADRYVLDRTLGELIWLTDMLFERQLPFSVIYITKAQTFGENIESEADFKELLLKLLATPVTEDAPQNLPLPSDADRIFTLPAKEAV